MDYKINNNDMKIIDLSGITLYFDSKQNNSTYCF